MRSNSQKYPLPPTRGELVVILRGVVELAAEAVEVAVV